MVTLRGEKKTRCLKAVFTKEAAEDIRCGTTQRAYPAELHWPEMVPTAEE
tara:strand:+ start:524 stop:673 length:150 start_codon:yes stop_codon:yes gene_type:complete